ncbi:MAG: hypothetical protein ABI114_05420 [Rhodanobacter sp.]
MFGSLIYRWLFPTHDAGAAVVRRVGRAVPSAMFRALPALGCVLYMPMPPMPLPWRASGMARGLLVDDVQLMPLLQVRWLVAATVVTTDGPREWLDCLDARGALCARLYLLPDTDYVAWDALLPLDDGVAPCLLPCLSQHLRPVSAQCVRFRSRRLAGLSVLGVDASTCLSPLGRQLANRVARAEALTLQAIPRH